MVSQSAQDFAFSLVDASQEYSTKFFILILGVIYLVALNLWTNSFNDTENWQLLSKFFVRIISIIYFFALPLFATTMLYRQYALVELSTLLYWSYSIMIITGAFIVTIYGWEKFLAIIGYPNLAPRLKKRSRQ